MEKQVPLDAFQGVVANGIAICDLGKFMGPNELESILLNLAGTSFTPSMISKIELKGNDKTLYETDGAKLTLTNAYMGQASDNTQVLIDFLDRKAMTAYAREVGAYDLRARSGLGRMRLEVTISGATAPQLTGLAEVSRANNDKDERRGGLKAQLVARRTRSTYVAPAAGEFAVPVPHLDPQSGGSVFRRINFFGSNITQLRAIREGNVEYQLTKAQNEVFQRRNGRTPQTGLVVFDPTQDGFVERCWDTRRRIASSAAMMLTFSASETITIETEELIPPGAY